jgi:tRNA pseudouridine55 synthase
VNSLHGIIVVNKPEGWTSQDVVSRLRKLAGGQRAGHAGTLDPQASGVLPIGLGQGTRVLEYLTLCGKGYLATICLGASTDTYDSSGTVTAQASIEHVTETEVEQALNRFRGLIEQRPPPYSALKRAGRPLYAYARAGIAVSIEPRAVRVDALTLRRFALPELEVEIECGSGFYVRSLAHDLGQTLGCYGHLSSLVRSHVGPFGLEQAQELEQVGEYAATNRLAEFLWALDAPLRDWPAVILAQPQCSDLANGKALRLSSSVTGQSAGLCRAYSSDGEIVAITRLQDGTLQPLKVFPAGQRGPNLAVSLPNGIIDSPETERLG